MTQISIGHHLLIAFLQDHALLFPTLAHIALDVFTSQASSVPCEQLFSGSKQVATDHRACLGPTVFEELVIMKSVWGPDLHNMAAWNNAQTEEVDIFDFEEMLIEDVDSAAWDMDLETFH